MDSLVFTLYTVLAATCFAVSILLYFTSPKRADQSQAETAYNTIKRTTSIASFLEAVAATTTAIHIAQGKDYLLLDNFFIPVLFYIQVSIMTFAMLKLMQSTRATHPTRIIKYNIPVAALFALHISMLVAIYGTRFNIGQYRSFLATTPSVVLRVTLYALVVWGIGYCTWLLYKEGTRFNAYTANYFSGRKFGEARWALSLTISYIVYFLVYAVDFTVSNATLDVHLTLFRLVVIMVNAVALFNIHESFGNVNAAFSVDNTAGDSDTADTAAANAAPAQQQQPSGIGNATAQTGTQLTSNFNERILDINTIILGWLSRTDKPWLREGITITQVASEMDLHPRLLSRYINNVMKINFNTWINNMKVAEAKTTIEEHPELNMTDIAIQTGFTDATSMSKIFKQIVGMPPSVYRANLGKK